MSEEGGSERSFRTLPQTNSSELDQTSLEATSQQFRDQLNTGTESFATAALIKAEELEEAGLTQKKGPVFRRDRLQTADWTHSEPTVSGEKKYAFTMGFHKEGPLKVLDNLIMEFANTSDGNYPATLEVEFAQNGFSRISLRWYGNKLSQIPGLAESNPINLFKGLFKERAQTDISDPRYGPEGIARESRITLDLKGRPTLLLTQYDYERRWDNDRFPRKTGIDYILQDDGTFRGQFRDVESASFFKDARTALKVAIKPTSLTSDQVIEVTKGLLGLLPGEEIKLGNTESGQVPPELIASIETQELIESVKKLMHEGKLDQKTINALDSILHPPDPSANKSK